MLVETIAIEYMIKSKIDPCDWHLTRDKKGVKSLVYYERFNCGRGKRVVIPWEEVRMTVKEAE